MDVAEFDYYWRIENYLFCCVQLREHPIIQSDSFFFGPGEWRLRHNPKVTSDELYFTLEYLGQRPENGNTANNSSTFSLIAKLALMHLDGNEWKKVGWRSISFIHRHIY